MLIFCSFAEEKKRRQLEEHGIRVEQVPLGSGDGRPDLARIVARLGELEITSLLIEGGALVNWTALATGVVDKIFLYYAPKILAGGGSVPFAGGEGFRRLSEAAQVKNIVLHRFGEDFAVEGYLRNPYLRRRRTSDVYRTHSGNRRNHFCRARGWPESRLRHPHHRKGNNDSIGIKDR